MKTRNRGSVGPYARRVKPSRTVRAEEKRQAVEATEPCEEHAHEYEYVALIDAKVCTICGAPE